jgi:hypothetical protein
LSAIGVLQRERDNDAHDRATWRQENGVKKMASRNRPADSVKRESSLNDLCHITPLHPLENDLKEGAFCGSKNRVIKKAIQKRLSTRARRGNAKVNPSSHQPAAQASGT